MMQDTTSIAALLDAALLDVARDALAEVDAAAVPLPHPVMLTARPVALPPMRALYQPEPEYVLRDLVGLFEANLRTGGHVERGNFVIIDDPHGPPGPSIDFADLEMTKAMPSDQPSTFRPGSRKPGERRWPAPVPKWARERRVSRGPR